MRVRASEVPMPLVAKLRVHPHEAQEKERRFRQSGRHGVFRVPDGLQGGLDCQERAGSR